MTQRRFSESSSAPPTRLVWKVDPALGRLANSFETLTEDNDRIVASNWNAGHRDCSGMDEDTFPLEVWGAGKGPCPDAKTRERTKRPELGLRELAGSYTAL